MAKGHRGANQHGRRCRHLCYPLVHGLGDERDGTEAGASRANASLPVQWKKLTFAELSRQLRETILGLPEGAAPALATALFMCLPLPDAWPKALTHLRRLGDLTNDPNVRRVLESFTAVYEEARDRLWRTTDGQTFSSFAVLGGHAASTRTRRRLLVFYGCEVLRAHGLRLDSTTGAPHAYELMHEILSTFWPTEQRPSAKPESIERAYFRGKDEVDSARFEVARRGSANGPGTALAEQGAALARYPSADEFRHHVVGLYGPQEHVWVPQPDPT